MTNTPAHKTKPRPSHTHVNNRHPTLHHDAHLATVKFNSYAITASDPFICLRENLLRLYPEALHVLRTLASIVNSLWKYVRASANDGNNEAREEKNKRIVYYNGGVRMTSRRTK